MAMTEYTRNALGVPTEVGRDAMDYPEGFDINDNPIFRGDKVRQLADGVILVKNEKEHFIANWEDEVLPALDSYYGEVEEV